MTPMKTETVDLMEGPCTAAHVMVEGEKKLLHLLRK